MSLSNNMKVGRRMRCAAGIAQWTRVYGYRKGENGEWLIEEAEANVVRRIFSEYVAGRSLPEICKGMEEDGIPAMGGGEKWSPTRVSYLLHNEKYAGDILMQKSYTIDPINQIKVDNRDAKIRQYYKEDHHPAIVDKETWQMAVTIATMKDRHRGISQYPYYGTLKCPICGANMVRFQHSRNNTTFAWTCGGKPSKKGNLRRQRTACPPYYIIEDYIENAFWDAVRAVDNRTLRELAAGGDTQRADQAKRMQELRQKAWSRTRRVEYKTLCDLVDGISFPQWSTMRVEWKAGMTTEVNIHYRKITDEPYPQITKEQAERTTLTRGTYLTEAYMVNGVPVFQGCPSLQVKSLKRAQSEVRDLVILEPSVYEPPVPKVYRTKHTEDNASPDLEIAVRKKDVSHEAHGRYCQP